MTQEGVESTAMRARAFVEAHGDALQRARAAALTGAASSREVEALLAPDASPESAVRALAVLDALGVRRGAAVERAVGALSIAQWEDGSFAFGAARDEADRIATTAAVAGLLAKTACVRQSVLDAAGAFLGAQWSPERAQGGDMHMLGGYASFFANFDHELSDAGLQWCGRELERGLRTGAIDALAVAGVLVRCDAKALPGARIEAGEIVLSLLAAQAQDGGFGAPFESMDARVEATLAALAALRRLGPARGATAR